MERLKGLFSTRTGKKHFTGVFTVGQNRKQIIRAQYGPGLVQVWSGYGRGVGFIASGGICHSRRKAGGGTGAGRCRASLFFKKCCLRSRILPVLRRHQCFLQGSQFNNVIYPRRQLVENKFSVLKRKFSGDLKARKFLMQIKANNQTVLILIRRCFQIMHRSPIFEINYLIGMTPKTLHILRSKWYHALGRDRSVIPFKAGRPFLNYLQKLL